MDELTRRGIAHFNAGRFDAALEDFRGAIAGGDGSAATRVLLAHVLAAAGRAPEAAAEFAAVIEAEPRHLPAYDGLAGLVLRAGGDAAPLTRATGLRAAPGLSKTLKLCALALRAAGDLAAAEKALRRVLRLTARDKDARAQLLEILRTTRAPVTDLERLKADEKRLRATLSKDPRDAAARRELGKTLRGLSRVAAGDEEKTLLAALALEPGNAETVRRLGEVLRRHALAHLAAGRFDEAEKALRRVLTLRPGDREARRQLLEVLNLRGRSLEGDLDRSEAALRRALAFAPKDPETRRLILDVLRRRAQPFLVAGDYRRAELVLRKAHAFEPKDKATMGRLVEALRLRARAYQSAGKRREARELLRRIQNLAPRDARAQLAQGEALFISGHEAQGRAHLSRSLALDRGDLSLGERFRALMKLGRHKDAVAAGERILDAGHGLDDLRAFWDPWEWDERLPRQRRQAELAAMEKALSAARGPWLHYYRGDLAGEPGVAASERIAEHDPKRYGWMYTKAASAALWAGKFAKAAEWFEISLRHEPVDWRTRAFLAETYLCLQSPDEAYAEMERALRAAPENEAGQVLAWRGAFDLWLGRYEAALPHLEQAHRLSAQCALCWKGGALLKLGRVDEALATLDEALRLYPLDFEAYVWRGEAKRLLGRHRQALKDLAANGIKDPTRPAQAWQWALFNRALVKRALGDLKGMSADFGEILPSVVGYIRRKKNLSLSGVPTPDEMAAILEAGLELARGFRREEYGQAIWMA